MSEKDANTSDDDLPLEWRGLPSLALPDGAHNSEKDTVFFHLPCRHNPTRTIFGVSCYRQIAADKLKNKSSDVTRCTVQKSVCVLSTLPLYGLLKAKLELITHAYFEQCDFGRVGLLAEMYEHLSHTVTADLVESQAFIGLSAREVLAGFKRNVLCLFKLILLEKRILFHAYPVQYLSHSVLALLSLFPRMIEAGLVESAFYATNSSARSQYDDNTENKAMSPKSEPSSSCQSPLREPAIAEEDLVKEIEVALNENSSENGLNVTKSHGSTRTSTEIDVATDALTYSAERRVTPYTRLVLDGWGFPLSIFTKGYLCHPYLSLAYMDWLSSHNVRAYVVGATNALFKQRQELFDAVVIVDDEGPRLEIADAELKRNVALTTADLRFCEYLLRHVFQTGNDYADATTWEGGDEWIRLQFRAYLLSLMATAQGGDPIKEEDFNRNFVRSWKGTHNYRVWLCGHHGDSMSAVAGHPFQGQTSMADVKLRLAHTMQSTEQGRKLNQALNQTSRYVMQTSRAVGGALKSVVGQFWTGPSEDQQ